ncbi:glycerol-3-phosphate responsive antiterminator [Propionibacterium freudenreichii]|uniref:glycerol-3-phosphate responsive antiterminator n=1 Tax=Propionibacterium freudenreichii TaxID=1744 RepID=UPI000BC32BBD|nr:glycerol-3-phosphate responsive antiterminator [Propionibacterium freudenreichii]MDK9659349.1 glycerol-3-phosphate responsive antiterminator [Propionibacterium freudenreichii]SCQ60605.1 Glycerol-3-phosphate responsive antiterminator, GlpP [Propionibacterium freudenreichii]SCQ67520.1 Glycerol-3-phosphate responsive antiterminator, GlpP [Propionibacterium freudenreichii]
MSDREAPHDERSATLPNALIHRLMAVPAGRSLMTRLAHSPVIPAVSGVDALEGFLDSPTESCLLGGLSVIALQRALTQLIAADIHPSVNLDSLSGLSRDRAGLDWLQAMGVTGLVTTRLSLLQSAPHYGFLAIQTLVLGGASLVDSALSALESAHAGLALVAPAPVLGRLDPAALPKLQPFLASGFVRNVDDVDDALAHGAIGVTSSARGLWGYERERS